MSCLTYKKYAMFPTNPSWIVVTCKDKSTVTKWRPFILLLNVSAMKQSGFMKCHCVNVTTRYHYHTATGLYERPVQRFTRRKVQYALVIMGSLDPQPKAVL